MPPKKLSGAQNRKRKAKVSDVSQKGATFLAKYLRQDPNGSTSEPCEGREPKDDLKKDDDFFSESETETCSEDEFHEQLDTVTNSPEADGVIATREQINDDHLNTSAFDASDPALWPAVINSALRDYFVLKGPDKIDANMIFPLNDEKRRFSINLCERSLDNGEKLIRRWLIYGASADKVYCFCCKLFDGDSKSLLAQSGHKNWKHISDYLKQHERSPKHFKAYSEWQEAERRLKSGTCIDEKHQRIIALETEHWRNVFERLIAITLFLSERNLAFRGSSDKFFTEHNGNFLGLVELLGRFDDVMREHIHRALAVTGSAHYCSPESQNELINLMGKKVLEDILMRLNKAKYYAIILDCTPDISHREQMSFTVRFVDDGGGDLRVKEHFIGFKNVHSSTGKALTEVLAETLQENHISIQNCRGQGYDNGANMKGKHQGVQARFSSLNPRAFFVPCCCHSLNLVVSDAALSSTSSVTMFGVLHRIYLLFGASAKRWAILTKHVKNLTLKPLCETRWESRIDSVKAVRFQFSEIEDALEEFAQMKEADSGVRHEAQCLANTLTSFQFLISVVVWYDILFQINVVSKTLQNQSMDIALTVELMQKCIAFLTDYKETGYVEALVIAREMAYKLGVPPEFEKLRIRQKRKHFNCEGYSNNDFQSILSSDPEKSFKEGFFDKLTNVAIDSVTERFVQLSDHGKKWGFLYNFSCFPEKEVLMKQCLALQEVLTDGDNSDINGVDVCTELAHLCHILPTDVHSPIQVLHFISSANLSDVFPNVWVAVRILLTLPVTVASCERSFSKLKLIKAYLRSTMSEERLTSLALLSIENDVAHSLNLSNCIKEFALKKARKVPL